MMVLQINFYMHVHITLVTMTVFQVYSGVKQLLKKVCSYPCRLELCTVVNHIH